MSFALAEAFVAEELSLIQSPDAPISREISGLRVTVEVKPPQAPIAETTARETMTRTPD
jgi:hypothetical protein